jgi:hypothetical protein
MTPGQQVLVSVLFGFFMSAGAAAKDTKPGQESVAPFKLRPAELLLSVSAEGVPSNMVCEPEVLATLCPVLTSAVSGWKFVPGKRSSQPTAMNVEMTLFLVAVPTTGGFGVQATSASIDLAPPLAQGAIAPSPRKFKPAPKYPMEDLRAGRTGTVILELLLQPGSDVPRIGQSWLDGKPADRHKTLVVAAQDAAKRWKIDHAPEQLSLCMPVSFVLDKPAARPEPEPCRPTYADEFAPPALITNVTDVTF